jgi:hypothetical protein
MARGLQLNLRSMPVAIFVCALTITLVTSCRENPPKPPKTVVENLEPLTRARTAMDRHDYKLAVGLLREALVRRPADLEAHYRLGVSASHLDKPDEASREFEWVVAHGRPRAPEVQLARDWLARRRAPRVSASAAPPVGNEPSPSKPETATLAGRAVGLDGIKSRLQLFLKGVPGTAVKDEYHLLRTDQQGNFRFAEVVPGDYMLTNAIAGPPAWRLRVSLAKGEHVTLDLSPANQVSVRDDFPNPRP